MSAQAKGEFDALVATLHDLPIERKGRRFERLVAWYLTAAPEYRHVVRRAYLWDEWPGRWGPDAGIDLVAVTHGGELWAIQAKAYLHQYSIKKADVDSFLSESNRLAFAYRLLIATTDHLSVRAARTIHDQEKPVGVKLLSQLRAEDVVWPVDLSQLQTPPPQRLTPLPHQTDAIEDVVSGLATAERGQLLMACGTGKTLTGLWIHEALASRRTLVILPSLSLLGQTLRAWSGQTSAPFEYRAVCSDETVTESDSFTAWTSDLGVPVTTDVNRVRDFLSPSRRRRVVFSTYHTPRR